VFFYKHGKGREVGTNGAIMVPTPRAAHGIAPKTQTFLQKQLKKGVRVATNQQKVTVCHVGMTNRKEQSNGVSSLKCWGKGRGTPGKERNPPKGGASLGKCGRARGGGNIDPCGAPALTRAARKKRISLVGEEKVFPGERLGRGHEAGHSGKTSSGKMRLQVAGRPPKTKYTKRRIPGMGTLSGGGCRLL